MQPQLGIAEQNRKEVAGILETILADEYVLYTKTRNYHWNVFGPHFNDYHKLFEEQYTALTEDIDEIAERIRSLGFKVASSLEEFQKNSQLKEHPGDYPNATSMVKNLLADHETIIATMRLKIPQIGKEYEDVGTEDFVTGLLEKHEKTAWMLRATISSE